MNVRFTLLFIGFFLASFFQRVSAQDISVSGVVKDKKTSETLVGITIKVEGTNKVTTSDMNGKFKVQAPRGSYLLFTYIGMKPYRYQVNSSGPLEILLEDANTSLNEVVVVGYGTQKNANVSGSISTIKSADLEKVNAVRVEDVIQGRASGVTVIQNGSPGSSPTVLIRGIPSYSGNDPLVIVDGVQQALVDFNSINPNDIESINILKDAATTAIYGVKGGNGVIVVTTKQGRKNQKPQLSFRSTYGIQQVANKINVLNATEYGAMINEGSTTSGGPVIFPNLGALGAGTNWQDQIFKNAPLMEHNFSASGGSETVSYYLAAGYTDQAGIVGGLSKSDYGRGNFTANLNFQLAKNLKFIVNATDVVLHSKGIAENSFNSVIGNALNFDPTVPVYNNVPNTIGKYGYSNLILAEVHNPLTTLDNTYNKSSGNKLYGKFELQYDVLKNLKVTSRFGYTNYNDNSKSFNPLVFYGPLNVDNSLNADGSTVTGKHNSVSSARNYNFNWRWETYANYDFNISNDNHFQTVVGTTLTRDAGNGINVSRQDVPFNSWTFADFSAATGVNTAANPSAQGAGYYEYFKKNISYFGRINYDYKEKYLASFSARRDGSTSFAVDRKFGNFYAGSLGWVVSQEDFFRNDIVSFLKFRASYGTTGNDNNTTLQVSTITSGGPYNTIGNSNGYNFSNVFVPGSTIGSQANPLLGWETQKQMDAGFDVKFFTNKLSLTADYFKKDVNGLIFVPSQSLYLGTIPAPSANVGSTSTKGFDATLGYNSKIGSDFSFSTSVTFTTFKSLVTGTNQDNTAKIYGGSYFNGQSQTSTVFEKGQAPGYFYGYKTAGLFQSAADIANSPKQPGAQPGDIKFVDVNGDGVIDSHDQTNIGNPFPKFTLGWNLNLSYKNFDFTSFVYASVGNKVFIAYDRNANYTNKTTTILGRWTGPGTTNSAQEPRYSFTDPNNNARVSDRYIRDGSFAKIKNLQLGYTFPKSLTKNVFSSVRIYAQARNLYTFTKYNGFDPEIPGGIFNTGVDYGSYPQARIYSFGLDLKF